MFHQVNALRRFDTLIGTEHFVGLAETLAHEDAIQDLVLFLLQQNW